MFDILIKRCIVRAYSHSPSVSLLSFMLTLSFMSCSAEIVVSILLYIRSVLSDREKTTEGWGGSRMEARKRRFVGMQREEGMNESKLYVTGEDE